MKQLKPQDRDRSDVIYQSENQVATYSDILCEKLDEIVYAEHLSPKKGMADYGTDWEEFVDIKKSDMIIVDELGYVPFDRIGAEHLFGFFSQCYEQTSLMVTTNLPFVDWPQVFGDDERLAGALLDRLTHHVHVIEIIAKSFRLNASLKNKKRSEKEKLQNN